VFKLGQHNLPGTATTAGNNKTIKDSLLDALT